MKKLYFSIIFLAFLLFCTRQSFAQIVGGNVFLQGAYLEIGEDNMGAFGTCSTPPGYHADEYGGTATGVTLNPLGALAEVYDWGHDGWAVGSPPFMGDYTLPGDPVEGWSVQVAGTEYDNWVSGGFPSICSGPFNIPGTITGYTNSGGVVTGTFTGAVAGLNIVAQSVVDTFGSAVVVTVKFYNMTSGIISDIYYSRMCDPDNASYFAGSAYTDNAIIHQNEDATHKVLVSATADNPTNFTNYLGNARYTYMGLGTKDCRAVCTYFCTHTPPFGPIAGGLGLTPGYLPSLMWGMSAATGYSYTLGDSDYADVGIDLVFNIGSLNPVGTPGDSAVISFAYIFNGSTGLDTAFPDPQLEVDNDSLLPSVPIPNAVYDTFDVCGLVGYDSLDINILHATTGNWTWSRWTWAPSTGLTSTTGTIDTIVTTGLPPSITYTITGTDSSGPGVMLNCETRVFYLTIMTCNQCTNNSPCQGDTLHLYRKGDSTGVTYAWRGPAGFTSTMQDPFIYPATLANAGEYYVIRTLLGVHDTDSTNVVIHPSPVVTAGSNSPLCTSPLGTLVLTATPASPGETFSWSGPDGFTSSLQDPTILSFGPANTGLYKVVTTTPFGCTDSNNTDAELIPPPPAPVITGVNLYCQGVAFVPFVVTDSSGTVLDSNLLWYTAATGGVGSTTPSTVNTSIPGYYTVWVSRKIGECEGPRGSFSVRVRTTPPAPHVSGLEQYCQYVDSFVALTVLTTTTGVAHWYTTATGGTATLTEPTINIAIAGSTTYYVSQIDSGCEGPRTPVTTVVHPKPAPPHVYPKPNCQYLHPIEDSAVASTTGDYLLWYGPGVTVGVTTPPSPPTLAAPDTLDYYVTETSIYGCVSDSALYVQIILKRPAPPQTSNVWYCQGGTPVALNAQVDSSANSSLQWYSGGVLLPSAPVPPDSLTTPPGNTTWYVTQTVNTCQSDSATVTVTILYKPVFSITATQPYVCQYDSISLYYNGPELVAPAYSWVLPEGASFAAGTHVYDDSVVINYDSAISASTVYLTVSDDSGKCKTTEPVTITIVSQPTAEAYTNPNVCLGDTVALALATRASDAYSYLWYIDYVSLLNSETVTIISSNSNSGGPYNISWVDSGLHVIEVQTFSSEGCRSAPSYDTVYVHGLPDANFKITSTNQSGCIDDTVQFTAEAANYSDSYVWSPASAFENVNTPVAWGRIEEAQTIITLTVTDPFGCTATTDMELEPNSCCTVWLPNAFTPNGDTHNDYFRPLYNGYHHFHVFQVMNRWGQIVFNSENNGMQWDGNYNGVPQDMGVYYYYLKYDCGGKTIEQKGDVTLIR